MTEANTNRGVLFDVKQCIGCGSCTVACKLWNDLGYEKPDVAGNAHGFDVELTDKNWTIVTYNREKDANGKDVLRFLKNQCMHCKEPACISVCFAHALYIDENGAVVCDPAKCAGCRYCMIACPYSVPKYEWDKVFPSIQKCQMCDSKIAAGEATSCSAVCPTGALTFGDRDELLALAKKKIAADPSYVNHVYGETEGGGTRWLYISDVPFEKLGLPINVPNTPINDYLHGYLKYTPVVFLGGGALFAALSIYTKRRAKVAGHGEGDE